MRRNVNIASQISEEIVKRFEDTVKTEIRNHNVAIKKYQTNFDKLQDDVGKLRVEQEKIKQQTEKTYQISQTNMYAETKRLEDGFDSQRRHIKESRNLIESKILEFEKQLSNSIGVECFDEFAKHINDRFESLDKKIEVSRNFYDEKLYSLNIEIVKCFTDLEMHNKETMDKLEESIRYLSDSLGIYKVDAKGFLKDLQVYKKEVFIQEKKIENLYTLIERINKRMT